MTGDDPGDGVAGRGLTPAASPEVRFPPGRWGVACSGGADSVALLRLAADAGAGAAVLHFDHVTRAGQSGRDAAFVGDLAATLGLPLVLGRRAGDDLTPAALRRERLAFFADACRRRAFDGVLLGHHAADQAETILLRIAHGGDAAAWRGMAADATVAGVHLVRPLLDARPEALRAWLATVGQPWREDTSNAEPISRRNRLRPAAGECRAALLAVGQACRDLAGAVEEARPTLADEPAVGTVADLPNLLASAAVRDWLRRRGVPAARVDAAVVGRVRQAAADAAGPRHVPLPGGLRLARRAGRLHVEPQPSPR